MGDYINGEKIGKHVTLSRKGNVNNNHLNNFSI